MKQEGQVIIYVNEAGDTRLNVLLEDETVWLSQSQICELYQTSKPNVSEHIKNIFEEGSWMRIQLFGKTEQLHLMGRHTK